MWVFVPAMVLISTRGGRKGAWPGGAGPRSWSWYLGAHDVHINQSRQLMYGDSAQLSGMA